MPSPGVWLPPEDELAAYRQFEQDRARRNDIQRQATADMAARLTSMTEAYPWVKPGVALAMAQMNAPEHVAARIAQVAALQKSSDPLGWREPGEVIDAAQEERQAEQQRLDDDGPIKRAIEGLSRGVMLAGDTLITELVTRPITALGTAAFSDSETIGSAYAKSAPSTGMLALDALREGRKVDLGTGFMLGGKLWAEHERLKHQLQLDGRFVTPGRLLSRVIFEPGSTPYNVLSGAVDATIQIALDPLGKGLKGVSALRKARAAFDADPALVTRLREAAGMVKGHRSDVIAERAAHWAQTPEARRLWERVAEEDDFYSIWASPLGQQIAKAPGGRRVLRALQAADNPDDVQRIVAPMLGVELATKPTVGALSRLAAGGDEFGAGSAARRLMLPVVGKRVDELRFWHDVPNSKVTWDDLDGGLETLHDYARNAKLPTERISTYLQRWSEIRSPFEARTKGYEIVTDMLDEIEVSLVEKFGVDPAKARNLTRIADQVHKDNAAFLSDAMADGTAGLGDHFVSAGELVRSPHSPTMLAEAMQDGMVLPDFRAMRRATSKFGPALDLPGVNGSVMFAQTLMDQVWRPLTVLRVGWMPRIVGEGQLRLAALGWDALPNHPFKTLLWIAGGKKATAPTGEQWQDIAEWRKATNFELYKAGGLDAQRAVHSGGRVVPKSDPAAPHGWADSIERMMDDSVMRRVAGADDLDTVKAWFRSDEARPIRESVARLQDEWAGMADDPNLANLYVDFADRLVTYHSGGNGAVRQIVATRRLEDGKAVRNAKDLRKGLQPFADSMPDEVWAPAQVVQRLSGSGQAHQLIDQWDDALNTAFYLIGGKWESIVNRSHALRQAHARHMLRLTEAMSPQEAARSLAWAEKQGFPKDLMAEFKQAVQRAGTNPRELTFGAGDEIARALALDDSLKVLYDVTKRGQWADIVRAFIPFGEAWREIVGTWGRIAVKEPQTIRRAQQAVQGIKGSSLFYTDPTSGEEMFAFPFGGLVSKVLFGSDTSKAEFVGSVKGLNLLGSSLLPGTGPLVQIPAAVLLPKSPKLDWVRSTLNPFGDPDVEGGVLETFMPAWLRRVVEGFVDSPERNRVFANVVKDVMATLVSTGEYSLDTPLEQKRTIDAATSRARALTIVRGIAQFISPTAPQIRFKKKDLEGNWWLAVAMGQEYRRLAYDEGLGDEAAMGALMARFGDDAHLWVESKSTMLQERALTTEGAAWERQNPDLVAKYANTVGFFAPGTEFGVFDYTAYKRVLDEGAGEALTPKQWALVSQGTLGSIAFERAKRLAAQTYAEGSREYRAVVSEVRAQLAEQYPGFDTFTGVGRRADTEAQIRELQRAAHDPAMADASPELVDALRVYFQYRQDAMFTLRRIGVSTFTAERARVVRDRLRQAAAQISDDAPEFLPVWHRVLARELGEEPTTGIERSAA